MIRKNTLRRTAKIKPNKPIRKPVMLAAEKKFLLAHRNKQTEQTITMFAGTLAEFAQAGASFEEMMFETNNVLHLINDKLASIKLPQIKREELREMYEVLLKRHKK